MQIVILGTKERKDIERIVKRSRRRDNWYRPNVLGSAPPRTNPQHCCQIGTHRCVFSYSVQSSTGKVFRHLSISVKERGLAPAPIAVKVIAQRFGFTGLTEDMLQTTARFPESWQIKTQFDHPVDDPCIVVLEDTGINERSN